MSNEENQFELASKLPRLFEVVYGGAVVFATISAVIYFAALPPAVIALLVIGAAAVAGQTQQEIVQVLAGGRST